MKKISLQVSNDTAEKINRLSEAEKSQLSRIIDLWVSNPKPILLVMEELGEYASKKGLTKEKLDELLKDE